MENQLLFLIKELPKDEEENVGEKEVREKQAGKQVGRTDEQVGEKQVGEKVGKQVGETYEHVRKQAVDLDIKTWDEQTIKKLEEKSKQNMDVFIDYINKLVCGKEKLEELKNKAKEIRKTVDANKHGNTNANSYVYAASLGYSLQAIERLSKFRKEADSILIKIVLLKKGYPINYFNFGEFLEKTNENFKELVKIGDGKFNLIKKEFNKLKEGIISSIEGKKEKNEWLNRKGELEYINEENEEKEILVEEKLKEMRENLIVEMPQRLKNSIDKIEEIKQVLKEGQMMENGLETSKKFLDETMKSHFIAMLEAFLISLKNNKELEDIKTSLLNGQELNKTEKKKIIKKLDTIKKEIKVENFKTCLDKLESIKTSFFSNEAKQMFIKEIAMFKKSLKKNKSFEEVLNKLELAKTSLLNLEDQTKLLDKLKNIKQVLEEKKGKNKVLELFEEVTNMLKKNKVYEMFFVNGTKTMITSLKEKEPYENVLNRLNVAIKRLTNCTIQINLLNELELTKQSFMKKESDERLFKHLEKLEQVLFKEGEILQIVNNLEEIKTKLEVEEDVITRESLINEELLTNLDQTVIRKLNIIIEKPGDNVGINNCAHWAIPIIGDSRNKIKNKDVEFINDLENYSIVATIEANQGLQKIDQKKLKKIKNTKNKPLLKNMLDLEKHLNESESVIKNFIELNAMIRIEDLAQIYRQIRLHSGRNKAVLELFKRTENLILTSKSTIKDVVNNNKGGKVAKEFEIGQQLLGVIIGGYSKKLDSQPEIYEKVDWGYLGQEAPEFSDTMSMLSSSTSMLDLGDLPMDQSLEDQLSTVDELPSMDEVSSPTNDSFFTSPSSKSSVGSDKELKFGSPASSTSFGSSPSMIELPKFGTFTSPSKSSVGSETELKSKFGSPASSTSFGSSPSMSDLSKFSGSTKKKPKKLSKQEKKKLKIHEEEVKKWNDWKFKDAGTVGQLKLLDVQKEAKNFFDWFNHVFSAIIKLDERNVQKFKENICEEEGMYCSPVSKIPEKIEGLIEEMNFLII
uniref:Uncharacterized protein n=1 Tax=Meloidogyne javanica TaxID=6303 RepID=A0A915LE96_MELJA